MRVYRASLLHFVDDPATHFNRAVEYFDDGLLAIEDGKVLHVGHYLETRHMLASDCVIEHFPDRLIVPGFIDGHVHYPQLEIIAAHGEQLLGWLNRYVFPAESKYFDYHYAGLMAETFVQELLRHGTTTALVFPTVHPQSVEAFFSVCEKQRLRMICGKVLMDRNAPAELCEPAHQAMHHSRDLIRRWHGTGRLNYAVTPRFAPTCSAELLKAAGQLLKEFDDVYLHTHFAENRGEVNWVRTLFPGCTHYLDVYHQAGLLTPRSIFAHGIYVDNAECRQLKSHQCRIAHCPTSNLFLGSGLFPLHFYQQHGIPWLLGTDIGAGTSLSLFATMSEAYKIQQLQNHSLSPLQNFYQATLGAAKALHLDHHIGNFETGKEADFIVINPHATALLHRRYNQSKTLDEKLFTLQTLADDRAIERTFILGTCRHTHLLEPHQPFLL